MIQEQIKVKYLPHQWNIYIFYFSDGENWEDDNNKVESLIGQIQKYTNLIGIGQILYYSYYDEDDSLLHHIREAILERDLDPNILRTFNFSRNYEDSEMAQETKMIAKFLGKDYDIGHDYEHNEEEEEEIEE